MLFSARISQIDSKCETARLYFAMTGEYDSSQVHKLRCTTSILAP